MMSKSGMMTNRVTMSGRTTSKMKKYRTTGVTKSKMITCDRVNARQMDRQHCNLLVPVGPSIVTRPMISVHPLHPPCVSPHVAETWSRVARTGAECVLRDVRAVGAVSIPLLYQYHHQCHLQQDMRVWRSSLSSILNLEPRAHPKSGPQCDLDLELDRYKTGH